MAAVGSSTPHFVHLIISAGAGRATSIADDGGNIRSVGCQHFGFSVGLRSTDE